MNRNEKINKLGNAIREYRGRYNVKNKNWIEYPRKSAGLRVRAWLGRLGLPVEESMVVIEGFKSIEEFDAWMRITK